MDLAKNKQWGRFIYNDNQLETIPLYDANEVLLKKLLEDGKEKVILIYSKGHLYPYNKLDL